jgi:urate oxidase
MAKLVKQRYGKARVRVLKILRADGLHTLREIEVRAQLSGGFETSYTAGDNSKVVPTDTIKNAIHVLARQHLGEEVERFAVLLGQHFVARYSQVAEATVEIHERSWDRLEVAGQLQPHSFREGSNARRFCRAVCREGSAEVAAGIRDLVILKSAGSGFEGYPKCEYTTLPETADRILATSFSATWDFARAPENYRRAGDAIVEAMLQVFAENFSPAAQATLFQMAEAALGVCPEVSEMSLAMPNKHYLPINLTPFGLENRNEVFLPTDEPYGLIEATVGRDD